MLRRMSSSTPPSDRWLTSGALSRQSRLSLKALRLYHTIGTPAGMQVRTEAAYEETYTTISKAQCEFRRSSRRTSRWKPS